MGRDAIKRVISNLVRTGWCVARKDRAPNGTFFMIYEIRDEPGPTLTDEEVRRALSLVSSEAASDEFAGAVSVPGAPENGVDPPTGYPSLADPSPGEAEVAYIDLQNKDLPRKESTQKAEREGARAREKHSLNLAEFKRRWPTIASDDQARVDRAWFDLSLEDGEAALAGIAPFIENQKRHGRSHPPAGFNYLGQKRWTLLDAKPETAAVLTSFALDSVEGKAIKALFDIAGKSPFFHQVYLRSGVLYWRGEITPQLLALAEVKHRGEWVTLSRQQAAAWDHFLADRLPSQLARNRLVEGASAPAYWPPRKDGTWSTAPEGGPTDDDLAVLANEGQR